MQEKKRYILVSIESQQKLSKPDASKLVQAAMLEGVGELGASKAKAFLKEFDEESQRGVVKCQTAMLKEVLACLALKASAAPNSSSNPGASASLAVRTWKVSGAIGNVWDAKMSKTRD